jgi:hypothetical protein
MLVILKKWKKLKWLGSIRVASLIIWLNKI